MCQSRSLLNQSRNKSLSTLIRVPFRMKIKEWKNFIKRSAITISQSVGCCRDSYIRDYLVNVCDVCVYIGADKPFRFT